MKSDKSIVLAALFAAAGACFGGDARTAVAAAEYAKYCRAITGREPPVARFAVDETLDAKYDEYRIMSEGDGVAFLGANRRAVLYAVYDFLSRRGGCRWFWDADIVPKRASIDVSGLDVREKSQHEYRGTRYFAHRGLTRFQAEHWGLEDWKREIDWCVKKRLNVMMLRIGQDDVFQRAFPDVCAYPDPAKPLPATGKGYDNRSLFWPLEFRGKLREQVVAYAQERGLLVPEDSGTMTHWYSRTPLDFVQKMKPDYFTEKTECYNDGKGTGLVWDIRQQKWIDAYWQLTETALTTYDNGDDTLIHTMGVGERKFSDDHEENIRTKLMIDKKVVDEALKRHPNARVLYPGWDFYYQWRGEDVKKFVEAREAAWKCQQPIVVALLPQGDTRSIALEKLLKERPFLKDFVPANCVLLVWRLKPGKIEMPEGQQGRRRNGPPPRPTTIDVRPLKADETKMWSMQQFASSL